MQIQKKVWKLIESTTHFTHITNLELSKAGTKDIGVYSTLSGAPELDTHLQI